MKVALSLLLLISIGQGAAAFCAQFSGHKSESEVERMTPDERVEEYCREESRHGVSHEYRHLLRRYISRDGLRATSAIARIMDEYDPTTPGQRSRERGKRFDAAFELLDRIDDAVVRARAFAEGRTAIAALKRAVERMRAAGFQSNDKYKDDFEYEKRVWYESAVDAVARMEGVNSRDRAIRDTLRIRFKIKLSDEELSEFVGYLISKDPHYPSATEVEMYKDINDLNEAGNPRQYRVLTDVEPFHKAYREYKAKTK